MHFITLLYFILTCIHSCSYEFRTIFVFFIDLFVKPRIKFKMSKTHPPELKKYMDKQVDLKLNGNRIVSGILRGFDPFMNIVVEDAVENLKNGEKNEIGMVVIRGNSIVIMEPKERLDQR
uniref:Small nuclear ribonucleoprotein G n=1 Tax=Onchocerca volvulus TaxID=6282 RepID=A0A8R1XS34_ONCVO